MPTTPDGRWSPNDGDPFDLTTDLAAMQVSNSTATANAIANNVPPQNYRVGTDAQRRAIPAGQLYEGLTYYTTDTDRNWFYSGTTWLPADPGLYQIRPDSVSGTGATILGNGSVQVTAGTSVGFNGVFSSRFRQYIISTKTTGRTGGAGMDFRMRAGGVDNSDANSYIFRRAQINAAGSFETQSSTTSTSLQPDATAGVNQVKSFIVTDPGTNVFTHWQLEGSGSEYSSTSAFVSNVSFTGMHLRSVAYDGFTAFVAQGSYNCHFTIYGRI